MNLRVWFFSGKGKTRQKDRECLYHFWKEQCRVLYTTEISKFSGFVKDTHRGKTPSNKTPALKESTNMNIWVVDTSNQPFVKGSSAETKFPKNKVVTCKTPFFLRGPFCTYHSICLKIGFWYGSFLCKWYVFNLSAFN